MISHQRNLSRGWSPPPLTEMTLHPFRKWFVPARWNKQASQPETTSFELNTTDGQFMSAPRICYGLHGVLVMIHVVLVIFSITHWEHRAILPFTPTNNDFWPVVLSASLQAFYIIYTAVLLFLTQRLAISRTLVRRLKLTSIHDISGAWSGLGSALYSIWQQMDLSASWWMTSAVAAYLASISVLHVTSSTLLQLQPFNATMSISVPTALGWSDDPLFFEGVKWQAIVASFPVVGRFPGLVPLGLANATLYDIPRTSSTLVGNATVNASTITSSCGLLPNVTLIPNISAANVPVDSGEYAILDYYVPWSDQIQFLPWKTINNNTLDMFLFGLTFMVSTLLEIEDSVREEASVLLTWEPSYSSSPISPNTRAVGQFPIEVYFVQCSFSATPAQVVVALEDNSVRNGNTMPPLQPSTPRQWEIYKWTSSKANYWQAGIATYLSSSPSSWMSFEGWWQATSATPSIYQPTIAEEYIMSLVGIDTTYQYNQYKNGSPPISNFTLTLNQLEATIAQAVAQLLWIAGKSSQLNEGKEMGNGTVNAKQEIIALRLNVNRIPLLFAVPASVIMLGLALHMTRASQDTQAVIPNTGALQLLWLGQHSVRIHEALEDVEHPTDANLRRAGMIDVCFATRIYDEEDQASMRSSTDSLSCQIDHDDKM